MITKKSNQLFVFANGGTQKFPNQTSDDAATITLSSEYVSPSVVVTAENLAAEAQAYLNSTDYIYLSQKEKGLSDEEVAEKYADIIVKRIQQRVIVSDYQDSL